MGFGGNGMADEADGVCREKKSVLECNAIWEEAGCDVDGPIGSRVDIDGSANGTDDGRKDDMLWMVAGIGDKKPKLDDRWDD